MQSALVTHSALQVFPVGVIPKFAKSQRPSVIYGEVASYTSQHTRPVAQSWLLEQVSPRALTLGVAGGVTVVPAGAHC